MAVNTSPQWRCSNRAEHGKDKPWAVAVVQPRFAANPHFLLRCQPCIDILERQEDIYDVAYLLTRRVRRAPQHDLGDDLKRAGQQLAHYRAANDSSAQPAD